METKYYTVSRIDGDYAWLTCTTAEEEPYFIARALLPQEIDEGSRLKLENAVTAALISFPSGS